MNLTKPQEIVEDTGDWHDRVHGVTNSRTWLQFSHSVVSDSLRPHGLQHARLPYPSLVPGACSNSCPLELMVPSNHLILCHPLLFLPSILPSIRVFSNELALYIMWPKYWSFSFSVNPSSEYSGLISFRMDRFDPLRRPLRCSLNIYLLNEPSHELADNSKNWLSPGECRFHLQADLLHLTVPCGKMEWSSRNSMAQEKLGLLAKSPRDSASSPEKMGDVSQQLIRMKTDAHKIPTTVCGLQWVAQSIEMVVVIISIQFSPNSFTSSVLFSSRKSALVHPGSPVRHSLPFSLALPSDC